ncbi:MAG: hypoxanthine phosphoribosyltransferase [Persephonella sp.]|nr:MAG: hypoxanthine phosphoribosyltransferase [Persephonella sp.]
MGLKIKNKELEILIPENKIKARLKSLADEIRREMKGNEEIIAIGILKGSFIFFADLVRELGNNIKIDFVVVSSYFDKMESSQNIVFKKDIETDIEGKNVLLIDDIIDTGRTLKALVEIFKKKNPKNLKTCVLLDKKERREVNYDADFIGFEIPDKFVVGYGLDWGEEGRTLKDIYFVK